MPFISFHFCWYFFFLVFLFQCLCSLLHINKIFEVGISEHLANKLQHMSIDLVEKVLLSVLRLSVPPVTNGSFELVSWCHSIFFVHGCLCFQANSSITEELDYVSNLVSTHTIVPHFKCTRRFVHAFYPFLWLLMIFSDLFRSLDAPIWSS